MSTKRDAKKANRSWRDVLPVHPAAKLFPPAISGERHALADDIAKNGLKQPIVLIRIPEWPGHAVLDGCNRLDALFDAGIAKVIRVGEESGPGEIAEVDFVRLPKGAAVFAADDVDPFSYVISANILRRHLTADQYRDLIGKFLKIDPSMSNRRIAEMMGKDDKTVASVRKELEATAEIPQLKSTTGKDGKTRPARPKTKEREILRQAKDIRNANREEARAKRIQTIADISKGNTALDTAKRHPIIYADPAYKWQSWSDETGMDRAPDYPTLTVEEICALPVGKLATPAAMLFLWVTVPLYAEALRIIEAWGFTYVTQIVWIKDKIGTGYYVRNQHELLLIAKRGNIPAPRPGDRPPSVVYAPRLAHSEKPAIFRDIIRKMYPELDRIELFARGEAPEGWAAWGNQASSKTGLTPKSPATPADESQTDLEDVIAAAAGPLPSNRPSPTEFLTASAVRQRRYHDKQRALRNGDDNAIENDRDADGGEGEEGGAL